MGMRLLVHVRLNKTVISFGALEDEGDDRAFWRNKTPIERLEAVELMRQSAYGYDPDTTRLHRVLEIAELTWR